MKKLMLLLCATLLMQGTALAQTKPGQMTGGRAHEMPSWFKSSFLNFKDDVEEARKAGRHILVFMDLNDCPYCARTLDENFRQGDTMEFIRKHFDVIAINIRGAGEVTWIDGATYTEQSLAQKLKVVGTPALVILSPEGKKVLQLNGYRTPPTLRHALEYVNDKAYRNQSLAAYTEEKQMSPVYKFREHPRFEKVTDFARYREPLAVINEGKEAARVEGRFYHFHFKEMLRFVSGRHYQRYDRFGSYLNDRQSELLQRGVNIDFGE